MDSRYGGIVCLVNCSVRDRTGGLDLDFDGKIIQVTYRNLLSNAFHEGIDYCVLTMADTPVATDPPVYILGLPFLRSSYAVFDCDNQQVHLAEATDCGSDIVAIGSGIDAVPTDGGCGMSVDAVASTVSSMSVLLGALAIEAGRYLLKRTVSR